MAHAGSVTKNEDRNTINFKSSAADANLLLPSFTGGLTGSKYQVIEVVGRWITLLPGRITCIRSITRPYA